MGNIIAHGCTTEAERRRHPLCTCAIQPPLVHSKYLVKISLLSIFLPKQYFLLPEETLCQAAKSGRKLTLRNEVEGEISEAFKQEKNV